MANLFDVNSYQPKFNDIFFFDNNIWVFLFYPQANVDVKKQKAYSIFLKKITERRCAVFINSLILSEFCNYWLQTEYKKWSQKQPSKTNYKKDFIGTDKFIEAVNDLKDVLPQIIKTTEKANDDFNAINFDNVISEFEKCDFNDSYYIELARTKGWKIVTDDADFFKNNRNGVDIITANI
ncbi:MAG: hypothetical protein PHT69_15155 [Bacteroidales bacterium]|nr:hypothetical protein [Bacteroidales bacterium]